MVALHFAVERSAMRPALPQRPFTPAHALARVLTAAVVGVLGQASFCPAAPHPVSDACEVMLNCYYRNGANFPDRGMFGALLNPDAFPDRFWL